MAPSLFKGLKILDLSRVFSGPFATRHFADLGATVIKIEPSTGDDSRHFPPLVNSWSGYFEVLNRRKKSLVIDLTNPSHYRKFLRLVRQADVVVENYPSRTKKKLKVDYPTLKKINPKIIYASIVGVSPDTNQKYYDVIAQAESGLASLSGIDKDLKMATSITDAFSGMKLAFAISSALYARQSSSLGCQITVSMKGSAFDLLEQNLIATSLSHQNPPKVGNHDSAIAPFGIFLTQDGSLALAIGTQSQWRIFAQWLISVNPYLDLHLFATNQDRLNNLPELIGIIESTFSQYTTAKLLKILKSLSLPVGAVASMNDILSDPDNYRHHLLKKINLPQVGSVTVPSGGIFISGYSTPKYRPAPKLVVPSSK